MSPTRHDRRTLSRSPAAGSRFTRAEKVVLAAWAMILAHVALRAWAVAGSWFYSDDFIFLGRTAAGDDTAAWLLEPHNIHFMPFALWLTTLVGHAGAFAWWAAVLQIVVLQALVAIACWWMLRTLFGDRPGILLPLGLFLVSPATVPSDVWWAAAINQLPHQLALFGAVAAHVTYLRRHQPSWAVLTGAFTVLGYASYTKSLLIPVLLAGITFFYFARGPFVRRLRSAVGDHWHVWVVQGGLLGAYVITYLTVVPRSPLPEPEVLLDTLDLSLVTNAVPSLLGGPWTWQTLAMPGSVGPRLFADPPLLLVVLAWCLLAALLLLQCLRFRWAWPPAVLVIGYAAAGAVLIATGRATAFGTSSAALELRYFADLPGVAALGLALAMFPLAGARQTLVRRDPVVLDLRVRRRWPVLLVTTLVVGSLVSTIGYVRPWHDPEQMPQQDYVATVRAQVQQAEDDRRTPLRLIDSAAPDSVLWAAGFPANMASRIFAPLGRRLQFVTYGTDLELIDQTGRIVPAAVEGGPRNEPGPVEGCGYRITDEPVDIPIAPVINFPFWVGIGYLSGGDGRITVTAGTAHQEVEVKQGLHTAFVLAAGEYSSVRITPTGSVGLCVDSVSVGAAIPLGSTP